MKLNSSILCCATILAAVGPGAILVARASAAPPAPAPVTAVERRLVHSQNQFGFKLFQTLDRQTPGKNLFISPSSIDTALDMAYNGAGGSTRTAMARTLSTQGFNVTELNRANQDLTASMEHGDPAVQLSIANSLWVRQGFPIRPDFAQRARQSYRAEAAALNFASPQAPQTINAWVSRSTNGKINAIIGSISPLARLFLINATYFKGHWADPFLKAATVPRAFTLASGVHKQVPMMSRSGDFSFAQTPQFQAVSLKYGTGRFHMDVVLPRPGHSLPELIRVLTPERWNSWMADLRPQQGTLRLPRFRMNYEATLNRTLEAMGMGIAFSNQADFRGISAAQHLYISEVKHKTYVDVNEEGTEAAAVTSVGVAATAFEPDQFRMTVDHPFLCAIRDTRTGTILFLGAIVDP